MKKLCRLRMEKGLSQRALAEKLGYHPSAIAQIEAGHRKPWPKIKKKIGEFFDVDWRDLD